MVKEESRQTEIFSLKKGTVPLSPYVSTRAQKTKKKNENLSGSCDVAVRVVIQRADAPLRQVVRTLRDVSLGRHPRLALELFRHLVHNLFPSVRSVARSVSQ